MYRVWEENGTRYTYGVGKVILRRDQKSPTYRGSGRRATCNFSAEVERHKTGAKNSKGYDEYDNTLLSFVAFGDVARYCRNLENQDKFVFFGEMEVDDYWTERNQTGEVVYKIVLDFIMAQPQEGAAATSGGGYADYPGDLPDGFEDLPDY